MISVFDMFKIGVGPSSSHTVGPMVAGKCFVDYLIEHDLLQDVSTIEVEIYGSLSLTGKGHRTDIAIIMGLAGNSPESVDCASIDSFVSKVYASQSLPLAHGRKNIAFNEHNLIFKHENLPLHENGLRFIAKQDAKIIYEQCYYSIGGGFIVDAEHFALKSSTQDKACRYDFSCADNLLTICKEQGLSISAVMLENEQELHSLLEITNYFAHVYQTMQDCIKRGLTTEGLLPGGLHISRRAAPLNRLIKAQASTNNDPMQVIDVINMFSFAVCEENAAGGKVVTAPTNGACGIVPAVLAYYDRYIEKVNEEIYLPYFLCCGAIGLLYKMNASISGAEVGCQGEVGVACSMAAAGLAELMGGSAAQVCCAAEIAMEHNLGLTCDPIGGLVQVPCIERNAIAAVKAVDAARIALRRNSEPCVSLDKVIAAMYETGKDMSAKYRETAQGGLAIKVKCS